MISLNNIFIKYGDRTLYDHINIVIKEGEKIGLVGRNGCGKSTLLKILSGEIKPDSGQLDIPGTIRIGYLSQIIKLNMQHTVKEAATEAFGLVLETRGQIESLEKELTKGDADTEEVMEISQKLADAHHQFNLLGGDQMDTQLELVLKGLGFKQEELQKKVGKLSGGWKMRIELAKLLLSQPNYLLLDEPTNHLDIESIIWLEKYLADYPYTVIVVSHDQRFLDNVTNRTIEIANGKAFDYKLSYSKYMVHREEQRELIEAAYKNQKKDIEHKEQLIDKFRAKKSKAKFAKALQTQVNKMERVTLDLTDNSRMRMQFQPAPRLPQVLFECKDLGKDYGPKKVFAGFNFNVLRQERIAFVGQNGQGKSTLAKMLVGDLEPTKGQLNRKDNLSQAYYAQDQAEKLDGNDTLLESIEHMAPPEWRPKLRNVLGAYLFSGEDAEKKVSVLSGGERARLALAGMMLHPINFLVLDEPTHHLDIQAKNILKEALLEYEGTLIVVSHDRQFLEGLTNKVLEFKDGEIIKHMGDIDTFLEKRNVGDILDLEKNSSNQNNQNNQKQQNTVPDKLDYKAKKEIQRKVQYAERDIEKIEKKIKEIELKLHDEAFFKSPDAQKAMKEYGDLKNKLEEKNKLWESLVEEMEV